ncbi:MAG: hypothetical protein E7183_05690 [Erysipelotrichaceae bacterium]|nr:hypothetical protein [Erysipelotrichaceae bacterium]
MKKIIYLIICLFSGLLLFSCSASNIKTYSGTPILSLEYVSIDYMGGSTRKYIFDFEKNELYLESEIPSFDEESIYDFVTDVNKLKTFTEEEEITLINKLYTYGLFKIKDNYKAPSGIMDGGGWNLAVEYSDGNKKVSKGSNNSPKKVFKNCATAFYDICGDGIVAYVSREYYLPPKVGYSFKTDNMLYSSDSLVKMVNYKWNNFESLDNSIYEINENADFDYEFYPNINCKIVLDTHNYNNAYSYKKFKKCIVISYDYNKDLTNENILYDDGWFKQISIDIEYNKIYVIRLEFKNGDYVEYTFNSLIK